MQISVNDLIKHNPLFVDVDGTLLIHPFPACGHKQDGQRPTLNQELVDAIRLYRDERPLFRTVAWSANGERYARDMLTSFGIISLFDVVIGKPGLLIDDAFDWLMLRPKIVVRNNENETYYIRSE